ncbi:Hypothetical protein GLP15_176 [Giardia lamblia P15]|uniref:Uncharacterized protein n=1 Tax=Giardia intestinalis (strain P15) TaxID=658858 RepID=E1F3I7_GIAIA|nr:Hypothetical protein GLP15_176 [Giardia lamblia P15]
MNAPTPTQWHPSADFLLSKDGVNLIPGRPLLDTGGNLGSTHLHTRDQTPSVPLSINLLDTATSFSIHNLPTSANLDATKRIHDIFLSDVQDSSLAEVSKIPVSSRLPATSVHQATEPTDPNLLSKLTAALHANKSLAADVQMLKEENQILRTTSVLTKGLTEPQKDFNATSINLLEALAEDEQSKDRMIISLRVTATSLERQNKELGDQVKDMQEQLSLLALAKLNDNLEVSEASATAANLHWKLEAANKQITALTNELQLKDATIEVLQKNVDNLTAQVQRFMGVNSTLTRCISEAAIPESSLGSLATADLQGKLEMYRLMTRQYEKSMETLVAEQKATDDMLSLLMDRATSMSSRLDRIEDSIVAVSRDRLVNIYRRRLEAAGLHVNG